MPHAISLLGERYGRLTVIEQAPNSPGTPGHPHGHRRWACICSCGNKVIVRGADLRRGHTVSCGCSKREQARIMGQGPTGGHGMTDTPTHNSWESMRQRCLNPHAANYARYGGRGITVCDEWASFSQFFADMGERPEGTTLDRINNDLGYFPGNCRWATVAEQNANRGPHTAT